MSFTGNPNDYGNPLQYYAEQMWAASHPEDIQAQQQAQNTTPTDYSGIIERLVNQHLSNMMAGAQPNPPTGPMPYDPRVPNAGLANSPVAQQILQHYGIPQPTPNPFMLFGNRPGQFGNRHPRVAGALEGALMTLAHMGPTDGTVGGGIGAVGRGLMGYEQQFRENLGNQFDMPFREAAQLQALQAGVDEHTMRMHQLELEPLDTAYKLAHMQDWLTAHQEQIRSIYSDVKIGSDGKAYGLNKRTQRYEQVPTPDGMTFHVPGEAGGLQAEIMNNVMSPDPALQAKGKQQLALWTQMYGSQAEARWGAIPGQVSEADKLNYETQRTRLSRIANAKPWDLMLSGQAQDLDSAGAMIRDAQTKLDNLRPPSPYGGSPYQDQLPPQPKPTPIPKNQGGKVGTGAAPAKHVSNPPTAPSDRSKALVDMLLNGK